MINYSIIIPHYNDAEALIKCLDSIPEREDIEVLVVNDGPQDDTDLLRKKINADTRNNLTVYANEGILRSAGSCRNTGLKHARGKWLVFSDADDYFDSGAFEAMDAHVDDDVDIVFFRVDSIIYPDMVQGTRHLYLVELLESYQEGKISDIVLKCGWTSPCGKMISHALVVNNNIRFDEVRYSNDVMFSVKTGYHAKRINTDNRTTYIAVRKPNTLTTTHTSESFTCRFDVFISRYKFLKEKYPRLTRRELIHIMHSSLHRKALSGIRNHGFPVAVYLLKQYAKNRIPPWD